MKKLLFIISLLNFTIVFPAAHSSSSSSSSSEKINKHFIATKLIQAVKDLNDVLFYNLGKENASKLIDEIENLLKLDFDVDAVDADGNTALILLCKDLFNVDFQKRAINSLLKKGANTKIENKNSQTALHVCLISGNPFGYGDEKEIKFKEEIAELLIKHGAIINEKFCPLIMSTRFIACHGSFKLVATLLNNGIRLRAIENESALSVAAILGNEKILELLLPFADRDLREHAFVEFVKYNNLCSNDFCLQDRDESCYERIKKLLEDSLKESSSSSSKCIIS